ncbi:hypothetical protein Patl1_20221 [Pistacia atlantica]|uniref:Uncharacterized protein n=1 Tax=Pistacia atlantica TaxID=434234 RepID=A0ACC1BJU9_9ROSI|nr:hypothetical protein Patl1_20221 [Pistacia atlantica]
MRSASEDYILLEQSKSDDELPQFHKESIKSYTRNFLLSLSELDTCKSLPCGLDQSILGEIPDSRTGLLHPCHGSDSRRFHGHLSRHPSPNPELGILGSGAFPRVSRISGDSASLVQGKGYNLLKRSNAAYKPPHCCKAKVHSRTESEDLNNDETFGSSELLTWDRAEDERRKDLFELMRKEQHKTFQEKQNKTCDEYKENLDPEVAEPLEASGNYNSPVSKHNEPDEFSTSLSPANDPVGLDFNAQTSAENLLPLVNKSMNFGTKSLINSSISEPFEVRRDHMEGYSFHSSDSAHQFLEENKPTVSTSSNEMKGGTVWNEKLEGHNSTNLSSGRNELAPKLISSTSTPDTNVISEQLYNCHTPNVIPGVLTGEDFEVSMLSELNEYYLTQRHSVKGWKSYKKKDRQPNSAAEHGASRHLLSFLEEPDQTDKEKFSKLSMASIGFAKDSQTTEFAGIQAHSVGMATGNDMLKPREFPFPASGNNKIFCPAVNESRSIGINCEGIISKSCCKRTAVSKIGESISISDDSQTNIGYNLGSESESKLSPVSGFDESADSIEEVCLPDEDSLITVDDFILPQDSTFSAEGGSVKSDFFTVNSQVDNSDELEALSLNRGEEIYTELALDGPIFDSYDVMGLETSYQSMHSKQSFSSFGQHHINPVKVFFRSSDAQEVQMSHKTRPLDSKNYLYNPQALHPFPTDVLSGHFQHPQADQRRFGHPLNSPPVQQMPTPSKSSPHQVRVLPRGSPSLHPSNEMNCYTQELLYPTQNLPLYYGQQYYQGLDMPIAGHIVGGISDKAAYNRLLEMEVRSRQAHPLAVAGHGHNSEIFSKQVDMGFWYGK